MSGRQQARVAAVAVGMATLLALTACGSDGNDAAAGTTTTATARSRRPAVSRLLDDL